MLNKSTAVLVLLFLLKFGCTLALPKDIKNRLRANNIPVNSVLVKNCSEECTSCVAANMSFGLNLFETAPNKVFFICETTEQKAKLITVLEHAGQENIAKNIISDPTLFQYLENQYCQFYDGNKILTLKANSLSPDLTSKIYRDSIEMVLTESRKYATPNGGIHYSYSLVNGQIMALSRELNQLVVLNSANPDTIDLNEKIDTVKLFNKLRLTEQDSIETLFRLKRNRMYGERVVDYELLSHSNDGFYYINVAVSAIHVMSLSEKKAAIKYIKKSLPKDFDISDNVFKNRYTFLLAKFDLDWNFVDYLSFTELPDGSNTNHYSSVFIDNDKAFANVKIMNNGDGNPTPLFIETQETGNELKYRFESKIKKPTWFSNKKVSPGFQWSFFETSNESPVYVTKLYPFVYDIKSDKSYEVPFDQVKIIMKKEKNRKYLYKRPCFQNFGLIRGKDGFSYMILCSVKTRDYYYAMFAPNGDFLYINNLVLATKELFPVYIFENRLVHFNSDKKQILFYELSRF